MENKHVWNRNALCLWLGALALCCLPLKVFSQSQTISDKIYWKQAGNVYTPHLDAVLGSIPGKVAIPPSGPTANGQLLEQLVNEWPKAKAESTVRLPNGQTSPPITTRARIKPALAGAAIGRFALKVAAPLQIGMALYDLAKELGFNVGRNPDGSIKVEKSDSSVCTVAPCYEYIFAGDPAAVWRSTPMAAAIDFQAWRASQGVHFTIEWCDPNPSYPLNLCKFVPSSGSPSFSGASYRSAAPSSSAYVPSTVQELQDSIASQSGWPEGSAISRTIADASAAGEQFPTEQPIVSGPATSPGTKSTLTKADGSTVTTNTTNNFNYAGDKVTHTTTTVVNNYNPTTNTTTTETTVEEPAKEQEQKDECTENPDRISCSELDTPDGDIPTTSKDLTYSPENLGFGNGTCPANITRTVHGQSVVLFDYTQPCNIISSYIKPLVLAISAFIAFMILTPGGKTE